MTDRTPEQINHNVDQALAICAETALNLTRLESSVERTNDAVEQTNRLIQDFIASASPRLLDLETSREQEEERLEELENNKLKMERAHLEHQSRIDRQDRIIELLTRQIGTSNPLD